MNPWQRIALSDYEAHMAHEDVGQLQALSRLTQAQLAAYPARTLLYLGIAGGNGLEYLEPERWDAIWGVDINAAYLAACRARYGRLGGRLRLLQRDLSQPCDLPRADLALANLLVEYIGVAAFCDRLRACQPCWISCVLQQDEGAGFVARTPYAACLDGLGEVHRTILPGDLRGALARLGYAPGYEQRVRLPQGKTLLRLDFALPCEPTMLK